MVIDLSFLQANLVLPILGICLCIGYVIKTSFPKVDNKLIPAILVVVGLVLSIFMERELNVNVILNGLFSALASTGLYELFKNFIERK